MLTWDPPPVVAQGDIQLDTLNALPAPILSPIRSPCAAQNAAEEPESGTEDAGDKSRRSGAAAIWMLELSQIEDLHLDELEGIGGGGGGLGSVINSERSVPLSSERSTIECPRKVQRPPPIKERRAFHPGGGDRHESPCPGRPPSRSVPSARHCQPAHRSSSTRPPQVLSEQQRLGNATKRSPKVAV